MQLSSGQQIAYDKIGAWLKTDEKRFVLAGYAGTGKAQPLTASIQTPNGPIKMGDIKPGDFVFGKNGNPVEVLGVFPQGLKHSYRVEFRDGSFTECCDEHLWEVTTQQTEYKGKPSKVLPLKDVVSAGIIRPSGAMRWKIPLCKPVLFAKTQIKYDPYMIGVLLGDGHICGTMVGFCGPDKQIADRVEASLPPELFLRTELRYNVPRYFIKTKKRQNDLMRYIKLLGINVKSMDKFIPKEYLFSSIENRISLLQGLMDTDGTSRGNRIGFSTGSIRLAKDLQFLVQSLGGTAILSSQKREDKNIEYSVNVKVLFNPFYIDRKASGWKKSDKNPPSRFIKSVTKMEPVEQQCISVDADDGIYLTDDFICTHNTTIASRLSDQVDGQSWFASFTGKAALNLRKKGNENALTLHKLIYIPKMKSAQSLIALRAELAKSPNDRDLQKRVAEEQKNLARPNFHVNLNSLAQTADLIVVDEFSMMTNQMVDDLESLAKKVLYLGDPAQLPPIGADNKLKPDYFLEEIHRQALDSPVLRAATTIRQGGKLQFCQEGDFRYGEKADFSWDDYHTADQVICGRNKNRQILNKKFRAKYGRTSKYPEIGDKVICLRNDHDLGLMNGMILNATNNCESAMNDDDTFNLSCQDEDSGFEDLNVWCGIFEGEEIKDHSWKLQGKQLFDFGNCITVHKSQGSEWENVLVYDDGFRLEDSAMRRRLIYTAITRASKTVKLVKAY